MNTEPKRRPVNVKRLARLMKAEAKEYRETGFIAFASGGDFVQITAEVMSEVAPLSEWTLNQDRGVGPYPYNHTVVIDGVMFLAISGEPIFLPL